MAGVYRYLAYDLRTNVALGELPLSGSFGDSLGGIELFTATVDITAETAVLHTANTIPEKTLIYIERDGVIQQSVIVWEREREGKDPAIQLRGASLPSFFRRQRLVTSLGPYTAVDQFTIAQAFMNAMQAQPGANIGIVVGSGTCGVTRDRTYYAYERKNIFDALDQLSNVNNGFDWAIDYSYVGGIPTKTLTLSYPRRGRAAGTTGLVFELGKSISDYKFLEDGTRSARSVDIFGAGDGADMKIGTYTRNDLIDLGYPLTSDYISLKDITEQSSIDAYAIAGADARAETPTFMTVTLKPNDVDGGLGHWIVGDDVKVSITDIHFPLGASGEPGYEHYHRILGYRTTVDLAGAEVIVVTLGKVISA